MAKRPTKGQRDQARRAPKRKRDYHAEYERRKAKGRAAGKTRQEARGHKPREHVERKRKAQRQFGVSASVLDRLRRKAVLQRVADLSAQGTKRPVNLRTVQKGMRMLSAQQLRAFIEAGSAGTVAVDPNGMLRRYGDGEAEEHAFEEGGGEEPLDAADDFVDWDWDIAEFEDDDTGEIINPFWYH